MAPYMVAGFFLLVALTAVLTFPEAVLALIKRLSAWANAMQIAPPSSLSLSAMLGGAWLFLLIMLGTIALTTPYYRGDAPWWFLALQGLAWLALLGSVLYGAVATFQKRYVALVVVLVDILIVPPALFLLFWGTWACC